MSELQNKIGGGLNKIQGSLQQGKQKIQTAQEMNQIQQSINHLRQKRQEMIVQIGSKMHKKLRLAQIQNSDFTSLSKEIEIIDKEIYKQALTLEDLRSFSQNVYICTSCEAEVHPSDKFCGSCGTPVVIVEKVEQLMKECNECAEQIPSSAAFCPCCGQATGKYQEDNVNVL
jgi:rRNA maturation endonuclease Nob1